MAPPNDEAGHGPGAGLTQKRARSGKRAPQRGGGARPAIVRLTPEATLRFHPEVRTRGQSGARYAEYCGAETVGEFLRWHPGPERLAKSDLANGLRRRRFETVPPLRPHGFARVELVRADRRVVWPDSPHGRDLAADRGAAIRRIGGASTLIAAKGLAMTDAGTLSLGGPWGHEATIAVLVDDYIVRLHAVGAAGVAEPWWTWGEDHGGLQLFLEETHSHLTHGPPMGIARWQSLERRAEQRDGRPTRQPPGAAAGEPTLEGGALPLAAPSGTPREARMVRATSPARGAAGHGADGDEEGPGSSLEVVAEGTPPALALPASKRGPEETQTIGGMKRAPGPTGRDPSRTGSPWPIRFSPLLPTRKARPERQTNRAAQG